MPPSLKLLQCPAEGHHDPATRRRTLNPPKETPQQALKRLLGELLPDKIHSAFEEGSQQSADAEKTMVAALLALADRDNGDGYFDLARLRQAAERAYPKSWENETYWPRFPLNRVATNYHTIRSQQSTTKSLTIATDSLQLAEKTVELGKDSAQAAKNSVLVSGVATAIALVSVLATLFAKDPKLDRDQTEAIIGAIKSTGSSGQEPLQLDAAQLDRVVGAITGMGHQAPAPPPKDPKDGKTHGTPAPSENSSSGASGVSTGGKPSGGTSN